MKFFAVGNAGAEMLRLLATPEFAAAQTAAVNTDAAVLSAGAILKFHLENKLLRGLGSGGDPERAKSLAEEQFSNLKTACAGADVVFILAGLGGGAGSGISSILARAAREAGALVLAFVTLPFEGEGPRREAQAQQGLEQLQAAADGVICLPGGKVLKLLDENTSLVDIFARVDSFLIEAVRGVWQLLTRPGLIQVHFSDLSAMLKDRHAENAFAFVEASGAARSREVVEKICTHPLLDEGRVLADSDAVLVSLTAGKDLTMSEISRVVEEVKRQCNHNNILVGAPLDNKLDGKLCVTIIAAKKSTTVPATLAARPSANNNPQVNISKTQRPRRSPGKAVQTQLPLSVVSKGRFDKSEPTLHKGEDLDVPTYIRRGYTLN
ncbi:MAG TPA: cell division protein FtsZ [Candidatus Sulfotelmatobacter sp.]|nr:cell division protein FtsZ [Candidatus Sulfotelmatobacter sp.]